MPTQIRISITAAITDRGASELAGSEGRGIRCSATVAYAGRVNLPLQLRSLTKCILIVLAFISSLQLFTILYFLHGTLGYVELVPEGSLDIHISCVYWVVSDTYIERQKLVELFARVVGYAHSWLDCQDCCDCSGQIEFDKFLAVSTHCGEMTVGRSCGQRMFGYMLRESRMLAHMVVFF